MHTSWMPVLHGELAFYFIKNTIKIYNTKNNNFFFQIY